MWLWYLAFIIEAIGIVTLLALIVFEKQPSKLDRDALRKEIERRKQAHQTYSHLQRELELDVCRELRRAP